MQTSAIKFINKPLLFIIFVPVLAINFLCGVHLFRLVSEQSVMKEDYAQVNSIRNGLLSVEVWKTHLRNIAANKFARFQLTKDEEDAVRTVVEKGINALMDE